MQRILVTRRVIEVVEFHLDDDEKAIEKAIALARDDYGDVISREVEAGTEIEHYD